MEKINGVRFEDWEAEKLQDKRVHFRAFSFFITSVVQRVQAAHHSITNQLKVRDTLTVKMCDYIMYIIIIVDIVYFQWYISFLI